LRQHAFEVTRLERTGGAAQATSSKAPVNTTARAQRNAKRWVGRSGMGRRPLGGGASVRVTRLGHNSRMPGSLRPSPSSRAPCWFDSEPVQRVLQAEMSELIPLLTAHIGVRALYLRPSAGSSETLSGNMMQAVTAVYRNGRGFAGDLRCDDAALPLGSDTLSLVYALHVLESAEDGEAQLREFARVLQPEGLLLLLVLSPASLWRLRWRSTGLAAWSATRLARAVTGAGLVVETLRSVGPAWPLGASESPRRRGALASLLDGLAAPLRTSQVLVARKRRPGMTAVGRVGGAPLRARVSPT
jgi:hypothetical protein